METLIDNLPRILAGFRETLYLLAASGAAAMVLGVVLAVIALGVYTAAFICEAVRSGINAVDVGQAEAARSIGMTFGQTLQTVVLPQAVRTVIPPLASILIALTKNTAIAEAFGVTEATYQLDSLVRDHPDVLYALFFGIAAGYILIVFAISGAAHLLE